LAVWFVPSLAIMDQTLKNLRDPAHPYRVALNKLFHGRVNIVDKSMALAGTNFKPGDIEANLTVLVASYDSFRSANKDGRKVYQENGSLPEFAGRGSAAIANGGQTDNLYQEPPGLGAMQSAEVSGTVPAAADAACRDSW
jgi:hypothetical protein